MTKTKENEAFDLYMDMCYIWDDLDSQAKKARGNKKNAPFVTLYNSETGNVEKYTIYKFRSAMNSGKLELSDRAILTY